ncbi:hypothetical protein CCM_04372 [Cordyceps militaris CM01]|uniref:DUF8035 domain-containing protein n=1 Tax=Cordyceps militaris (strain CM01) TaxID=983644 RepID=G3JEI7_CORMM|nr:uncharacterized protein CCM_04372 [Cordyceps militaris CM01]EGX93000.1 hypothetical protein CCM_04372 [Cordyceps militaris CM01]
MSRGDRYEQDRYYERDRDYERDRAGGGGAYSRDRVVEDDRYYMRGGRGPEVEERDRLYERDVDFDRRRPVYEEPRYADHLARDFERQVALDERDLETRRPRSDIFDRRPEPGPLIRHSPPPPARSRYEYDERDTYRDSYREPARDPYRDELYPPAPRSERPDHLREVVRERTIERDRSPAGSRASRSHRSHSRSRSRSISSHSRSGGASVRQEYPKKGKTRIPSTLVEKKIIIDLGYPYVEEGNLIIIQKALGQEHIDELLRLSEEYSKASVPITVPAPPKSAAGGIIEERREERHRPHHDEIKQEVIITPPPPPQPIYIQAPTPPAPVYTYAPAPPAPAPASSAPIIIDAHPRSPRRATVEVVDKTVIRDDYPRYLKGDYEEETLVVGPLVRARSRSRSRARGDIRAEIRALEREYEGSQRHHHHHHRDEDEWDIIRTERVEDGQLVVYEERVDRISSHPKPARLEKDKKGRITLSLPAYR